MSALPASGPGPRSRVLVIGRSRNVLETVMRDLVDLGLAAEGTVRPESAAQDFDAGGFDLAAIGGGVDAVTRAGIKRAFASRNPAIRLIDVEAPVAVHRIVAALDGAAPAPGIDLTAYFARIGFNGSPAPDLETLRALQARHPAAIPFEAIDVLLDRGIDLAPEAIDAKLVGAGRGGYCFEQNSLFRRALDAIGYQAKGLLARVLWNLPAGSRPQPRTHMVVQVDLDGVPWLVDVGFGSVVPTAPLRLDTEEPQSTPHEAFRVFPFGTEWLVQVRREGVWLPVYLVSRDAVQDADYEAANWYTAAHPSSHFRRSLVVARTTPEARCTLLNGRLTIRRPEGETERRHLDAHGIEGVLAETFGLPVAPDWRPIIERAAVAE